MQWPNEIAKIKLSKLGQFGQEVHDNLIRLCKWKKEAERIIKGNKNGVVKEEKEEKVGCRRLLVN